MLANVLDYDDGHRLTKGHPGAIVIPAMLAMAEAVDATPTAFLEAVLVGYEVALRAGVLIHDREAQYHASASWGSLGVAVAAGRLLGLDAAALRHAVGIAEYHAPIALMPRAVADPAMTKDTCGWGGLIGITSAQLARRGFTGIDSEFMLADAQLGLGERWGVEELYLKPYPCCRWTQPAVDAALAMHADGARAELIDRIVVRTFAAADLLSRRRPTNTEEMQYSLVWPVATALARGAFGVDEVLTAFDDPAAIALAERTDVVVDEAFTEAFPARRRAALEVRLRDGRTLRSGPVEAGGEPGSDGWEEVVLGKVRRFLQPDAPARIEITTTPPAGAVRGRGRDGLVDLLCFGLAREAGGGPIMTQAAARTQADRLEAIRALAPRFRARARASDDASTFPTENFADLRTADLLALTAPVELGGQGLWSDGAFTPFYEVLEALAHADTSTSQLVQVHSHALGFLARHGSPEQHERFLAPIVAGGQIVASVGSETAPRATAPGVYSSELERDGDGWTVTCSKYFASLGPAADWLLLWLAVPGSEPYPDRTVTVLVPRDAPGVRLVDEWDVVGMRPTVSWSVHVEGLRVDADQVIGAPGAWVRDDPRTFTLAFAANHVGLAGAALEFAVEWVRERPTRPTRTWCSRRSACSPRRCRAPARPSSPPPAPGTRAATPAPRPSP